MYTRASENTHKCTRLNENEISSFQKGLGPLATEVFWTSSPSVTSMNGHTLSYSEHNQINCTLLYIHTYVIFIKSVCMYAAMYICELIILE